MLQDANAVRPGQGLGEVLIPFPEQRILRTPEPRDEVVVRHAGETTIYETPHDMAEAVLARAPQVRELREMFARAQALLDEGEQLRRQAVALMKTAEDQDKTAIARLVAAEKAEARVRDYAFQLAVGVLLGVAAAIVAVACGL